MFFIQDEDADFMAKLAKLMSAAGTQLLNSYSKYDSIIFYFFVQFFHKQYHALVKSNSRFSFHTFLLLYFVEVIFLFSFSLMTVIFNF